MASNMEKDSFTYQQERSNFLRELQQFHQNYGTPIPRMPTIGGREVDLYLLYTQVQELGGWNKVAEAELWDDLLGEFGLPYACTNAGLTLRQIYLRYLYQYDRDHNTDESVVQAEEEAQAGSSKRVKLGPMAGVPVRYNYRQHNVSVLVRAANGLSTDLLQPHEYNKLHRALLSGLPNEVDFAVNVCTLLSNEGRRKMRLNACPGLLDLFMAHVGIFREDSSSLFDLAQEGWSKGPQRNFIQFWLGSVSDKEVKKLVSPTSLYEDSKKDKPPEMSKDVVAVAEDGEEEEEISLSEVLALGRDLGMHDVEGQRILQLAMIVRNLSFEEENVKVLAKNILVFRFLLLCIHCKYSTLRQLALDTMGNIAVQMVMEPLNCKSTQLLLQTLSRCISSPDRFEVVRGLEILSGLCQVAGNSSVLESCLSESLYRDMVSYLSVQDIQLVVYTLEALYQLSELGSEVCEAIARIRVVIDLLVSLLTVEAQSYGPNSLTGIKVVEHVPAGATSTVTGAPTPPPAANRQRPMAPPPHQPTPSQPQLQPMAPPQQRPQPLQQIHPAPRPMVVSVADKPALLQPSSSTITMARAPAPVVASTVMQPKPAHAPISVPTPAPAVSQPALPAPPMEMDSESTTCKWLQAHYEYGNHVMTKSDMYHEYLASCSRLGTVVNSACFSKCVRVAFPKVDSKRIGVDQRCSEMQYRGLQRRAQALPFPPDLSAVTPDSQVIRSLLAKKVSQNMALAVHNGMPVTSIGLPGVPAQYVPQPGQQVPTVQVISVHPSQFITQRPAPEVDILAQAAEAAGLDESDGGPEESSWPAEDVPTVQPPPPAAAGSPTDPNFNLEVCSQAELAGTVVSDERHQARIERVVNACVDSPTAAAPGSEEATITRVNNSGLDVLKQHISSSTTRPPPLHPTETLTPQAAAQSKSKEEKSQGKPLASGASSTHSKPVINSQSHQEPAHNNSPLNGKEPCKPADLSISLPPQLNGGVCLNGPIESPPLTKPVMNGEVHAEDLAENKLGLSAAELKKYKLAQLIDPKYSKDTLALNGLVKHVGNGDCVVNFAKEGELRGPDNLIGEEERTCKVEPKLERIVENGFISDSDKNVEKVDFHGINDHASVGKCASPMSSQAATNYVSVSTVSSNVRSAPVWQPPMGTLSPGVPSATPSSSLPGAPVRLTAPVTAASAAPVIMTTSQGATQVVVMSGGSDSNATLSAVGSLTIADILRNKLESSEDRPSTPEMPTAAQLQAQLAQATGLQASLAMPAAGTVAARLAAPSLPVTTSYQVANVIRVAPAALLPSSSTGQIVLRTSGGVPIQPHPAAAAPGQIPIAPKPSVTSSVILPAGLQVASAQQGILVHQQPTTFTVQTQPLMTVSSPGLKRPAELSSGVEERPAKLVRYELVNGSASAAPLHVDKGELMCEWSGCGKRFETAKEVKRHVTKTHWDKSASFGVCCWTGCDSLRRQKYSLLSHLTDRHCTEQALRASHAKRLALAKQGQTEPPANNVRKVVGQAPVYPNDAALQAIRRFAIRPPYPEFGEVKEGPVTKHIRLTSALVLRNMAKFSEIARSLLWKHEEHLSYVALSSVEASTAIATCLGELSRRSQLNDH